MDKKLYKIIKGIYSQEQIFRGKVLRRELMIPGLFAIEGKDLKEYLDTKDPLLLSEEEVSKIRNGFHASKKKLTLSEKKRFLNCFDGYSEEVRGLFQYNVSIIRQILSSIPDLIPSKLDDEGIRIAQICKNVSKMMLDGLADYENIIQRSLKEDFNETALNSSLSRRVILLQTAKLANGFIEFSFLTINTLWFRQNVYEYYYGPKNKKNEKAEMINQIVSGIKANLSPEIKKIERKIETTNNAVNGLNEKIEKGIELIENRNEEEKPKRLQIAKCAKDICRILENDYKMIINQDTIEKYLHRFDDNLEMGNKIALPSYEHAMYFDKNNFIVWCRETFIPYYLEHRRIRVKNKTPRRSSSDAAFDEAARQEYEDEEEGDDNY